MVAGCQAPRAVLADTGRQNSESGHCAEMTPGRVRHLRSPVATSCPQADGDGIQRTEDASFHEAFKRPRTDSAKRGVLVGIIVGHVDQRRTTCSATAVRGRYETSPAQGSSVPGWLVC